MAEGLPCKKNDHTGLGNLTNTLFTIHFTDLEEPRRTTKGNFKYPLEEILFLTIYSIISGWFEDWEDITYFFWQNSVRMA